VCTSTLILLSLHCSYFSIAVYSELAINDKHTCLKTCQHGDQDKFISLKRKGGNVAFGDDSSAKILEKGVVELGRENVKAKNVLFFEDLNHNLLSVSKMCDQGYTLTFDS
jgi:hypothetical protein